ncbi:MAG: type II toxin-antitoxin system prevent-host-death family antitoxin [Dehalococcoidia bacterium]
MESITVRELRQNATEYLRRVAAGETIEIRSRGRVQALLVPAPDEDMDPIARLVMEGRLTPAEGSLANWQPLAPVPGKPLPSEALAELREFER